MASYIASFLAGALVGGAVFPAVVIIKHPPPCNIKPLQPDVMIYGAAAGALSMTALPPVGGVLVIAGVAFWFAQTSWTTKQGYINWLNAQVVKYPQVNKGVQWARARIQQLV